MRKQLLLDAGERVLWTAIQAGLGAVTVETFDVPPLYGVIVAAALATLKAYVASKVGKKGTASTAPGV